MKRWRNWIAVLARATPADRIMVVEALTMLSVMRVAVSIVPFKRLASRLGGAHTPGAELVEDAPAETALKVARAITVVGRHTVWTNTCYIKALATHLMLRRRGIASTILMGVRKEAGTGRLEGHAWLRCGSAVIMGAPQHVGYGAVAAFSWRPAEDGRRTP